MRYRPPSVTISPMKRGNAPEFIGSEAPFPFSPGSPTHGDFEAICRNGRRAKNFSMGTRTYKGTSWSLRWAALLEPGPWQAMRLLTPRKRPGPSRSVPRLQARRLRQTEVSKVKFGSPQSLGLAHRRANREAAETSPYVPTTACPDCVGRFRGFVTWRPSTSPRPSSSRSTAT
jgi:hypothetical protein